jgi:two-component system, response regulator PhcR
MIPKNRNASSILFVDDEPLSTKWFEKTFGNEYNIYCANSADSAMMLLKVYGDEIAIVVSDFQMPETNGLDLLRAINTTHPWIVKILVTAYADKALVMDAVNQQLVFRVLEKPWDDTVMRRSLSAALTAFQHDFTKRDHLENSINGMRDSLTFIGAELNSPLTVISSCLGMIQSALSEVNTAEPMPKRLKEMLPALQSAQRHVLTSQNLMTSFTQSTTTAFASSESNPIQAARLVQLLISEMPLPHTPNHDIKFNMDVKVDFPIASKQNLVYLCLTNIWQSAVQAVRNGTNSPSIEIKIVGSTTPKGLAGHTISITDNGPGMPAEVLQHLFDTPSSKNRHITATEGTMGLRFCKKIMRSLEGDLSVNSNQSGTSVTLHFSSDIKE